MPKPIEKVVAGTRLPKPGTRNTEYFQRGEDVPLDTYSEKQVRGMLATGSLLVAQGDVDPTKRAIEPVELKAPKKAEKKSESTPTPSKK